MADDVVVLDGARTAWAEYSGTPGFGKLKDVTAVDLAVAASRAAIEKSGVNPDAVDHVVMGNVMQTGLGAIYGARHVGLKADVPVERPAMTINRLCGSGIESVNLAARLIRLGEADVVLAGGMENMSQAPHVVRGLRGSPVRFGADITMVDSLLESLKDPYCDLFMAQTAENCARKWGITREEQDKYAFRSHREGARAVQSGVFREEIVPVGNVDQDDHIKPETTLEKLAGLRPAFGKDGMVTAGNASGMVDGAAAVVVASEKRAKKEGLRFIGRIVDCAVVGVPPEMMGIGPAPSIRMVIEKAGLSMDQVDLFEINEAFAAQYLAVEKELDLDRSKVNVNGGSIALGHPLGATGTRLILTVLYELRRRKKRYGIASACIGGGQGIAMLLEAK